MEGGGRKYLSQFHRIFNIFSGKPLCFCKAPIQMIQNGCNFGFVAMKLVSFYSLVWLLLCVSISKLSHLSQGGRGSENFLEVTISNCHKWHGEGGSEGQFGHCHEIRSFFFLKASLRSSCFRLTALSTWLAWLIHLLWKFGLPLRLKNVFAINLTLPCLLRVQQGLPWYLLAGWQRKRQMQCPQLTEQMLCLLSWLIIGRLKASIHHNFEEFWV